MGSEGLPSGPRSAARSTGPWNKEILLGSSGVASMRRAIGSLTSSTSPLFHSRSTAKYSPALAVILKGLPLSLTAAGPAAQKG